MCTPETRALLRACGERTPRGSGVDEDERQNATVLERDFSVPMSHPDLCSTSVLFGVTLDPVKVRAILFAVATMLSAPLVTGCGSRHAWIAQPVATEEVRIVPQDVYRRNNRLYVRVTLWNLGRSPLVVARENVQVQLATGRVVGVASRKTYTVEPGASQAVFVDFKDDDIKDATIAQVFWTGAVFDGDRVVMIPATSVREETE